MCGFPRPEGGQFQQGENEMSAYERYMKAAPFSAEFHAAAADAIEEAVEYGTLSKMFPHIVSCWKERVIEERRLAEKAMIYPAHGGEP